jgi:predicted transcriptional regulator
MSRALVVSIKPEFAEKIFNGTKTIELRKSVPKVSPGDMVVVYCTNPVKAVLGVCQVKEVLKLEPSLMWKKHSRKLGIDQKRYNEYFENSDIAVGIKLTSISKLEKILSLNDIKQFFPFFQPPQTFRYYPKNAVLKTYLENDFIN